VPITSELVTDVLYCLIEIEEFQPVKAGHPAMIAERPSGCRPLDEVVIDPHDGVPPRRLPPGGHPIRVPRAELGLTSVLWS
jgi:hypothetical protein